MTDLTSALPDVLAGHRDDIRRSILGLVRDEAEAEDLTQETLLRGYKKLPTLKSPASLLPWLYRIATNVSHDRFRQPSHRMRRSLDSSTDAAIESDAGVPVPDAGIRLDLAMEQEEMSGCVQRYMAGLSDAYRAVILLHDTQELTNPQIAEMLGISLATVKIRLHRRKQQTFSPARACRTMPRRVHAPAMQHCSRQAAVVEW